MESRRDNDDNVNAAVDSWWEEEKGRPRLRQVKEIKEDSKRTGLTNSIVQFSQYIMWTAIILKN